ncbi:zinc D-Ala-D-Ala carboxypeptidase [Enterococcus sp. DIV2402]|uniref:Zinc D-Ala-D-Ala carboxypeptidase n=1 Tax=Candidatus Enterococcus lowellii TaxID=2230877 RepID=A0ABZ2SRL9_9ENTE|nr:M15 family metallopeptidase [Enterococcus sp. DIV2402]MBO0462938.1 M15 family metallopeptidase [Enterococcus sp. DIV2402]
MNIKLGKLLIATIIMGSFPVNLFAEETVTSTTDSDISSESISDISESQTSVTSESQSFETTESLVETTDSLENTETTTEESSTSVSEQLSSETNSSTMSETKTTETTTSESSTETSQETEETTEEPQIQLFQQAVSLPYATILSTAKIWDDTLKKELGTTATLINQTVKVENKLTKNNLTYYKIATKDRSLGYVEAKVLELTKEGNGKHHSYGKYVTVKNDQYMWQNFSWEKRTTNAAKKNRTYQARGYYQHFNGSRYLTLYDNNGNWAGYTNENNVVVADGQQGIYLANNKYVTVKNDQYMWQNFSWQKRTTNAAKKNRTYQARGYYQHFNGSRYLTLYDNNGNWAGYTNENNVAVANGPQGIYQADSKQVTVTNDQYMWQNFSWQKRTTNAAKKNHTYQARGYYYHYNGSRYLTLYNNQGTWMGYVNENNTKKSSPQGDAISTSKRVTIPSSNYEVWQNFDWQRKTTARQLSGKIYHVKVYYQHRNGSTYYSLYDSKNNWQGYINATGTRTVETRQGITYVDGILIANKKHSLPANYNPGENSTAGGKFRQLLRAMQQLNMDVSNSYSGFRSYSYQSVLYQNYVRTYGQAAADRFSARPGYSEHQTGLAFDLIHNNGSLLEKSREANWLAANAHQYGFIIRYKAGKEAITGYQYEPWHVRYIGSQASAIYRSNKTLEEYLGIPGGGY